ncbi:unnamed protein product [Gordionus sp. m RMFG-2023]|uniref:probable NADH dehydrogenase [ubiquinone] 1 alpha subcomplex subunit 12 n=1 Tax=Gordionus sp. m RMFG-2023 TaxID=3053472 RepID=UPI0030DFD769
MNPITNYLEKVKRLRTIIQANGGLLKSLVKIYYTDDLKEGRLIGKDQFGNEYFENNSYFFGRNRWVEYTRKVGLDYNATQVPPGWHAWIHYMTDQAPKSNDPKYDWMEPYQQNMTGTHHKYVPFSTMPKKIFSWDPNQNKKLP